MITIRLDPDLIGMELKYELRDMCLSSIISRVRAHRGGTHFPLCFLAALGRKLMVKVVEARTPRKEDVVHLIAK